MHLRMGLAHWSRQGHRLANNAAEDMMTFDDAVDFMVKKANLTPPNAKAEVGRYCSWPTQASSYLTGMLEIVDIRTRWLARRGAADRTALRAFHDAITSTGSMPTALAERAISG